MSANDETRIVEAVQGIVTTSPLEELTLKKVRAALAKRLKDVDLRKYKDFVKATVVAQAQQKAAVQADGGDDNDVKDNGHKSADKGDATTKGNDEDNNEEEEEEEEEEEGEEEDGEEEDDEEEDDEEDEEDVDDEDEEVDDDDVVETPASRSRRARRSEAIAPRRGSSRGGRSRGAMVLPESLALIVESTTATGRQLYSAVNRYIIANGLQDPENSRQVICDPFLKDAFEVERFPLADLSKLCAAVSQTLLQNERKKRDIKRKASSSGTKKRKTGFASPKLLSDAMAELTGKTSMSRTELSKFLRDYVKEHNLQDPKDGRKIIFDERLQQIFKRKTTTFFKLSQLLTPHLRASNDE